MHGTAQGPLMLFAKKSLIYVNDREISLLSSQCDIRAFPVPWEKRSSEWFTAFLQLPKSHVIEERSLEECTSSAHRASSSRALDFQPFLDPITTPPAKLLQDSKMWLVRTVRSRSYSQSCVLTGCRKLLHLSADRWRDFCIFFVPYSIANTPWAILLSYKDSPTCHRGKWSVARCLKLAPGNVPSKAGLTYIAIHDTCCVLECTCHSQLEFHAKSQLWKLSS